MGIKLSYENPLLNWEELEELRKAQARIEAEELRLQEEE